MRNRWFLVIGGLLLAAGLSLFLSARAFAAAYLAGMGLLLLLAGLLVGQRYQPELADPPDGFVFAGERFVDPTSRRTVEVWQDPVSGRRVYVLARDPAQSGRES